MRQVRLHNTGRGRSHSTRVRVIVLLAAASLGPWLMGALLATPVDAPTPNSRPPPGSTPPPARPLPDFEPQAHPQAHPQARPAATGSSDQLELAGQTGSYVFTPTCSSRLMQVRHTEAQARWTHRTAPETALGGAVVTHVDLFVSRDIKEQVVAATGGGKSDEEALLVMVRAQVGIDWALIGFRVGLAGGSETSERQVPATNATATTTMISKREIVLPALTLRLGPQRLHARLALADGGWQLRPTDLTLGIGIGDGGADLTAPRDIRGFVGVGADLADAPSNGFIYTGLRINLKPINVGVQGRFGEDGWAGGLWLGFTL